VDAKRYPRSIACPAAGVVLRWLADENFNNDILRALFRRKPGINIVRAQDVGLTQDEAIPQIERALGNLGDASRLQRIIVFLGDGTVVMWPW